MKYNNIAYLLLLLLLFSCSNRKQRIEKEVIKFTSSQVYFPFDTADICKNTPLYDNEKAKSEIRLVSYFDKINCTACEVSKIAEYESQYYKSPLFNNVKFIYIVNVTPAQKEKVYSLFCRYRIKGCLYLDTCKEFVRANPGFPQNPLLHTFMVNGNDSVIFAGNPFENSKVMDLWIKIKKEKAL